MITPEYGRGWKERAEAERALRQWRENQRNPTFTKGFAIVAGLGGALIFGHAVTDLSWHSLPIAPFGAMFMSLLFIVPSVLRQEERARREARETLIRLGLWERMP